jgi:coenzyme F420 biosynthesis associated uncharacterized protein
MAGSGPRVDPAVAREAVRDLRRCAREAVDPVASYTGLSAPYTSGAVVVVDRPAWIRANVESLGMVLDPVIAKLRLTRATTNAAVTEVTGAVAALEIGAALGFLSSKVLGQYELFTADPDATPRLLLVAPNVVEIERVLGVDPHDFRLWVCLHEETHRVQFGGVPWLRPWLLSQIETYVSQLELDPSMLKQRLSDIAGAVVGLARGGDITGVLDAVMSKDQRDALARLTAVMALLEGHADVVMDGVGPETVGSVADIRSRFEGRRENPPPMQAVARRLLGLDAKIAQYRDGAAFVRGVVDLVGMEGFHRVWSGPEALPAPDELADPTRWVRRVVPELDPSAAAG